jgi:hypothetical protein
MQAPALPAFYNFKYTDDAGNMTSDSYLFNDQTFQVLNSRLTIWGIVFPTLTDADVAALPANTAIGTTWFNSDLNALQFKGNTGIQQITSV